MVLFNRRLDHYWRSLELWVRPDHWRISGTLAVHLPTRWFTNNYLWSSVLRGAQLGSDCLVLVTRRTYSRGGKAEERPDRCEMSDAQGVPDSRGSIRHQNLAGGFHDGWRASQILASRKHALINIDILSTVPSLVLVLSLYPHLGKTKLRARLSLDLSSTDEVHCSWSTLDSILLQFPLGGVVFIFILLTGYLSSRIPNIRLVLLVLCCLPVIAGCAMIWRSNWTHRAAAPVAGYTIIGFFGPVVSLIISIGMANVAGATKKSCTAAAIFVAYCVGNVRMF